MAWYQLNHSSYKVGVKRFHIATWFGVVIYRKFEFTVEKRKELCPICSDELYDVELMVVGFLLGIGVLPVMSGVVLRIMRRMVCLCGLRLSLSGVAVALKI
jgi:hypothetical protein